MVENLSCVLDNFVFLIFIYHNNNIFGIVSQGKYMKNSVYAIIEVKML